jgi:hypothetical protein
MGGPGSGRRPGGGKSKSKKLTTAQLLKKGKYDASSPGGKTPKTGKLRSVQVHGGRFGSSMTFGK